MSECTLCEWALMAWGAASIVGLAVTLLRFVWRHCLRPRRSLSVYGAGRGAWAVVTGCTDGIGLEFTRELAKAKFNVLLVSRMQSKLDALAKELSSEFGVETRTFQVDMSHQVDRHVMEGKWAALADTCAELNVGVLINNAGVGDEMPARFLDAEVNRQRDIVAVNINAAVEVVRAVMPAMLAQRPPKQRSLILNISSASSIAPSPMISVYGASKAFLCAWSTAVAAEYERDQVDVEVHTPFFVVSKLSKRRRPTATVPTANKYVKSALSKVGHGEWFGWSPYFTHGLMELAMQLNPFKKFFVKKSLAMHADIRRRALKKLEAKK